MGKEHAYKTPAVPLRFMPRRVSEVFFFDTGKNMDDKSATFYFARIDCVYPDG